MRNRRTPRTPRTPLLILTLAATTAMVLSACGRADDDDGSADTPPEPTTAPLTAADLEDRTFLSTAVTGYDLVDGSVLRLAFEGDRLAVQAGCNNMGGSWSLEDGRLVVGTMMSTQMACEDPLMEQDTWMSTFLAAGPAIQLDGDRLTLSGDGTTIELLDRRVADPDRPLLETRWEVDTIIINEGASTVPLGTTASLTFADDTVAVEAGCNTGSASVTYEVDAESGSSGTMVLGPLALTKMMCEDEAMELEAAVSSLFDQSVTFEIVADRLNLTGETSGLSLVAAE